MEELEQEEAEEEAEEALDEVVVWKGEKEANQWLMNQNKTTGNSLSLDYLLLKREDEQAGRQAIMISLFLPM